MSAVDKQQTAADLRAAVGVLDLYGWGQGMAWNAETGALCLLGALGQACAQSPDLAYTCEGVAPRFDQAVLAVHEVVAEIEPKVNTASLLPYWNDRCGRVKEDVTAVLEKAAARIEERA